MAGLPRDRSGWVLRESGPADGNHAVLLLPGAMCTATFFDDVLAEPAIAGAPIRFVATTLPGFGGTPPLEELGMEADAAAAGALARELECDVVVGHSLGGNVAIEMAAAGEFSGPIVLLSPAFSTQDESKELRTLDRLGRIPGLGLLPWTILVKAMSSAMKDSFPGERHDALVAEMKRNDPRFLRVKVRRYFEYLEAHGSIAPRLCESGARAWVAFGDGDDDVDLQRAEREHLDGCPSVTMATIPKAGHFTLNENPSAVAALIVEAVASA